MLAVGNPLDQFEWHEFLIGIFENPLHDRSVHGICIDGVAQRIVFGERNDGVIFAGKRNSLDGSIGHRYASPRGKIPEIVIVLAPLSSLYRTRQSPTRSRNPSVPVSAVTLLFWAKGSAARSSILPMIVRSMLLGILRSRRRASFVIRTSNTEATVSIGEHSVKSRFTDSPDRGSASSRVSVTVCSRAATSCACVHRQPEAEGSPIGQVSTPNSSR